MAAEFGQIESLILRGCLCDGLPGCFNGPSAREIHENRCGAEPNLVGQVANGCQPAADWQSACPSAGNGAHEFGVGVSPLSPADARAAEAADRASRSMNVDVFSAGILRVGDDPD